MSKELTEQWRNGTLPRGYYYYKTKVGVKVIGFQLMGFKYPYDGNYNTIDSVKEVLAPVPTYDQFSQTVKKAEELERRLKEAEIVIKFYADAQPLTDEEKQMSAEKYHLVYGLKANDYLEKYGVEK